MTTPIASFKAVPGTRLEMLLAEYAEAKPAADAAEERLKSVTAAIKAELGALAPNAGRIEIVSDATPRPLRMSYIESWRLDTKRLKAEKPEIYAGYAQKSGTWQLRSV